MVVSIIVVGIGGLVEIVPTMIVKSNVPTIEAVKPYTPLELEGRDLYVKEGCYNCHTQMIRPLRFETARYGEYSKSGEFVYDHPFQWGSKRTGPDLAREGGLRSNNWHYQHLIAPKDISPGSIMPAYTCLKDNVVDASMLPKKIAAMRTMGVPYPEGYEDKAIQDYADQATKIATDIVNNFPKELLFKKKVEEEVAKLQDKEIIAVIAYLQRLGTDIKVK
jgi:cytochrome c oxidase cbb3-type subunit I/II